MRETLTALLAFIIFSMVFNDLVIGMFGAVSLMAALFFMEVFDWERYA